MNITHVEQDLKHILNNTIIQTHEPLCKYTYTKTGGKADLYITPKTIDEAQKVVQYAYENHIPMTYLGNGSNIIIRDGGIRGIVLNLLSIQYIDVDEDIISVGSGTKIIDVSYKALEHELSGLEFACGIPGSVGGAVYMNAGAYGGEIKDCLIEVTAITPEGEMITLTNEDLELSYRTSLVQKNNYVVVEAKFKCNKGNFEEIRLMMDDLTERRESKQPLEYPSCGSVFQRPPGNFAGKLIQDSHLQGYRIGGVEVSKKHAGFMVNVDNGTASDYENLIKHVQSVVFENFGVQLHREVRIIGEHLYKRSDK